MSHDSWQALRSYVRDGEHPYKFCLSSFSPEDEQSIQYCSKHQDQTDSFYTSMQSSNIIYKSCVKFLCRCFCCRQDAAVVRRIQRMCDTAIGLESFAGAEKEKNPVFKEYHGEYREHLKSRTG